MHRAEKALGKLRKSSALEFELNSSDLTFVWTLNAKARNVSGDAVVDLLRQEDSLVEA
jgi:hypothetical protein